MTIIFIETEGGDIVKTFFADMIVKFKEKNILKNAFEGRVKYLGEGNYIVMMRSIFMFNLPKFVLKFMMKKGLKKAGYTNMLRFRSDEEAVKVLLKWDK